MDFSVPLCVNTAISFFNILRLTNTVSVQNGKKESIETKESKPKKKNCLRK